MPRGWAATSRHAPRPGWGAAAFGNSLPKVTEISSLEPFPRPPPRTTPLSLPAWDVPRLLGCCALPPPVFPGQLETRPTPFPCLWKAGAGPAPLGWAGLWLGLYHPTSDFQAGTLGP